MGKLAVMPLFRSKTAPTIGLIGFGAFGRLTAQHLQAWFPLLAFDPALPSTGEAQGVRFADLAAVAACPIVILAMPVAHLADAIDEIRPHLQPGALVLDVGSVKVGPARIMRELLPDTVEIVGTHPLFGPQSARNGIAGLKMAVCPIRGDSARRVAAFLRRAFGLHVFITTPEAHDREAAVVQGLTHLIAKVLVQMEPLPTRMTTASFDKLMSAVEMVRYDPPSVFLAIEQANPYAVEVRERFFDLADALRASLNAHED
jgi:prephenate dehydrogenase